jgi:S1-C subfamily serine protease
VAKTGKTYYVATNLHVVGGEGTIYGVRTYDGEVYFADDQEPQQFPTTKIYRFGEEKADGTIQGFDLAIIKLQSDKDYPIASVPLSRVLASLQNPAAPLVTKGEKTFVSGWPDPDDQAPRREFRFSTGVITEVVPPTTDGGYGLFYTSVTRRGMSGGPVFNDKGEVVGIHGRAGSVVNPTANLGIIVSNLTQEAVRKAQLAIFKLPGYAPPEPITLTQKAVPPTAKVIPDIFKDFTRDFKSAALRECPSGGSGWIDLGGKDDQCPSR